MKTTHVFLLLAFFSFAMMEAQIKIGENPQNLDPSSVLELESNTRVLVITRMNTTQMENTTPLQGAMVYNTDTQCVHFYDGTQWINPCDRPDEQTFSADAIVNDNPTIEITENGTNFNFEVGRIRGENVVPTSLNGQVHIQAGSVTGAQIQDASVSFDKLGIGTTSGELLQWNGTQWILVDESALAVTEADAIIGNEVVGPADATLVLSGTGIDTDPFLLDVNNGGINTNELADNAVNSQKIGDGQVGTLDLANDAVTNLKMADDAVDTDEIVDDAVTAAKIDVSVAGTGLNQAANGSLEIDNSNINPDWTNITSIPAGFADNVDDNTTYTAGTGITLTGTTFSVENTGIAPDWTNITNIPAGFADNTDDNTTYSAGTGITLTGTTFSVDNTGLAPDWTSITSIPVGFADNTDDNTTYTAGTGITLTGTMFSVDNTAVAPDWTNITGIPAGFADNTDDNTTYTAGTGITLTGTTFSVDNTGVAPDWTNITSIPAGFADNTDDNTTYAAGTGLTLTGTTFSVNNLGGDILGAPNATVINNDAVTLATIADGTANGQVMQWNGTDWVLVDDSALDVVDEIALSGQVAAATGVAGAYTINNAAITPTSVIQLTVQENNPGNPIMIQLVNQLAGQFTVQVYEFILGTPTPTNANWHYIVLAP
ncbi:hypothetical protein M3P19_14245 [Muricauda sp. 2012CJ35-5]|uniref:Uncharacterized protein n=1 Tax=Flagellimonas spongiicola TaxID=2942208 RepID=A0ABT0PUW1_9FLAO|nr:hypothetical protein [Allomuricauda spongiicola]MCL6275177.1 hypothetical protein [Allomuricauda spongiicola]